MKEELLKRTVKGPDGVEFEVEPLRDYYCEAAPTVMPGAYIKIVEDLFNWARAESLWILGFGTGCGAIEMRPLMTPRFDAYRYGIQWRPTPRQANLLVISGYLSVKTLKRAIRAYEQMQNPKYVVGLGSCTIIRWPHELARLPGCRRTVTWTRSERAGGQHLQRYLVHAGRRRGRLVRLCARCFC